jgi:transcriptional regulator with XRE-family HTH domain
MPAPQRAQKRLWKKSKRDDMRICGRWHLSTKIYKLLKNASLETLYMPISPDKTIGSILRKRREKIFAGHGGQQLFAAKIGLERQTYSAWENGNRRPSLKYIERLAKGFGVTAKALQKEIDAAIAGAEADTPVAPARRDAAWWRAQVDLLKELLVGKDAEIKRLTADNRSLDEENARLREAAAALAQKPASTRRRTGSA